MMIFLIFWLWILKYNCSVYIHTVALENFHPYQHEHHLVEKVISVHQWSSVGMCLWAQRLRMRKGVPASVAHVVVADVGHHGRRSRRRTSSGDARDGSLQKRICIHGLQRDLLKTVCFWYKKRQKYTWLPDKLQLRMIMPYIMWEYR